jgi:hypothetical protein
VTLTRTGLAVSGAALVASCWLSAGVAPLVDAIQGQPVAADFIRDYVTARARIEDGRGPPPEGARANELGARMGTRRVLLIGGPYYLRPPPALLVVLPFAYLPWRAATLAWTALSVAALVWLAATLVGLAAPGLRRRAAAPWVVAVTVGLALWPPTLHCIEKGQWSILLGAVTAAGYRALERARPHRSGTLFAVAAAVKATPVVLLGLLVARSRLALGTMLLALAVIAVAALVVTGLAPWRQFLLDSPRDVSVWATWLANTASLQGLYARLLTIGPFTRPLTIAPLASRVAFVLSGLALLLGAAAVSARRREPRAVAFWSGAWLTLPVLLNPLGWSHVVLMLLAPFAVVFRDGGTGARAATVVWLALLSIPRQRLLAWAGPVPVPPLPGLVLSVHALAAVGLYATLLILAVAATRRVHHHVAEPAPNRE